ncbi:alpha-L-rhamnosidase C-terminal domain-containing protein [Cohnella silvisoli]|uniref:Alpha-L-rhamnosidase C-terminal domain-containing protein n=1 Tax=Cohnella silvisoli TaxID=2873699 RepID=A0ABV1L063_9BACL|nr:alpha-L-rhamnosidase C-terminal domain-containing protein [Cohnella silvisoli]MCD9024791.1 alpha-L-rhamnosidase N-terminal domain-containing protein [Cohnella silvisoli]
MEDRKRWKASWIWAEKDRNVQGNEMVYFRKTFIIQETGASLSVSISADSRYRLYVNGHSAVVGPCRGDLKTQYYETVDVSRYLRPGLNVLAVKVVHYVHDGARPEGVFFSHTGGLIVDGSVVLADGTCAGSIGTDEAWLCLRDESTVFLPETITCVGGPEKVDGSLVPEGWERPEGSASGNWRPAIVVKETESPADGFLAPWQLAPRPIPFLYERERSFVRIMRQEGEARVANVFSGRNWLRVEDGKSAAVELDAGELTTGYLRFVLEGGAGGQIRFLCSESYETPDGQKGVRDDTSGKQLRGYTESYSVAGGREETYETFLFRTFRFVRIEIEASLGEPLVIHHANYRETGYPLDVRASFACSDASLNPLWDISVRTLQRCMHDNYFDCPYYEQLQYSMDTRLQILFTYAISGDDRLARKAIYDFHSSLMPSGMLQCRYPSVIQQVIPGFALYWVMMVYDHLLYCGDKAFTARFRPTVDAVLDWFERETGDAGLVGPAPLRYWSYVDWVREWEETRGVPDTKGPVAVYSLLYADALNKAAVMNEQTGRPDTAVEYRKRAARTLEAVKRTCWSEEKKLFRDGPSLEQYSQHTQIWAILAGAADESVAGRLAEALVADKSLAQVSYSMAFFLFRALSETGRYDSSFPLWELWREQVALHLTTWLEDPISQRSDCHAWGSVPLYDFTSEILGVKPAAVGYEAIRIEPKPGPLAWAKGRVVAGDRIVEVSWEKDGDLFRLSVSGLEDAPAEIRLPDGSEYASKGRNRFDVVSGRGQAGA